MSVPRAEQSPAEIVGRVILQIDAVVDLASSLGNEPDFGLITQIEGWDSLSDEAKGQIQLYAREKGFKEIPEVEESHLDGRGDSAERGEKSLKRRFLAYEVALDEEGGVKYSERFTERLDDGTDEERVKAARFEFPKEVVERLSEDEAFRQAASVRITEMRGELDDSRGVKLFVDRPKDDAGRIIPKWKYRIGGRTREDVFSVEELPDEILQLIRTNDRYWQEKAYRQWFGRAMHAKREQVLVRQLVKELSMPEAEAEHNDDERRAEDARKSSETIGRLRAAFKGENGNVTPSALRQASREIFLDFAELVHDRESADRYRGVIEDFVWTGAVTKARLAGKEDPGVTRADVGSAVTDVLDRYLAGLATAESARGAEQEARSATPSLHGKLKELGGRAFQRGAGSKDTSATRIPLRRVDGLPRQVRDVLSAVVDSVLAESVPPEVSERVTDLACRYVQSDSPVSERFRKQVASVERGQLLVRDADLLAAAVRKFAQQVKDR